MMTRSYVVFCIVFSMLRTLVLCKNVVSMSDFWRMFHVLLYERTSLIFVFFDFCVLSFGIWFREWAFQYLLKIQNRVF